MQTVVHLVRNYYSHQDFCIITPYDAQREAIQKELKDKGLPWERRVFNVDSFQGQLAKLFRRKYLHSRLRHSGNEADFVIVSVVRSGKHPGFLKSDNRMNVMLTRCRKGLIIVSSKSFLRGAGGGTLLGKLEQEWVTKLEDAAWIDWRLVAEKKCGLPHGRDTALPPINRRAPPTLSQASVLIQTPGKVSGAKERQTSTCDDKATSETPRRRGRQRRSPTVLEQLLVMCLAQPEAMSRAKPGPNRPSQAKPEQPSKQTVVNRGAPPTSPPRGSAPIQPSAKVSGTGKGQKSTSNHTTTSGTPKHAQSYANTNIRSEA